MYGYGGNDELHGGAGGDDIRGATGDDDLIDAHGSDSDDVCDGVGSDLIIVEDNDYNDRIFDYVNEGVAEFFFIDSDGGPQDYIASVQSCPI